MTCKQVIAAYELNEDGITIIFESGNIMHFVPKMVDFIKRNVYYNATGRYYTDKSNFDNIIGKCVITELDSNNHIVKTFPLSSTKNQKYRRSSEWNRLKSQVAMRNKCDICGTVFTDKSYEVHHTLYYIDKTIEYTDLDPNNYALVCRECHQLIHDGKLIYSIKDQEWLTKRKRK